MRGDLRRRVRLKSSLVLTNRTEDLLASNRTRFNRTKDLLTVSPSPTASDESQTLRKKKSKIFLPRRVHSGELDRFAAKSARSIEK